MLRFPACLTRSLLTWIVSGLYLRGGASGSKPPEMLGMFLHLTDRQNTVICIALHAMTVNVLQDVCCEPKYVKNWFAAWTAPRTPVGELFQVPTPQISA